MRRKKKKRAHLEVNKINVDILFREKNKSHYTRTVYIATTRVVPKVMSNNFL